MKKGYSRQGVCLCGIKETAKKKRELLLWVQQVKGRWVYVNFSILTVKKPVYGLGAAVYDANTGDCT